MGTLEAYAKLAIGVAELGVSGAINQGVKIVGGLSSIPYTAVYGADAAVAVQEGIKDNNGYSPRSEGARLIGEMMAPVGQRVNAGLMSVRNFSENYIGDAATTIIGAGIHAGLDSLATVGGIRGVQGVVEAGMAGKSWQVSTGGLRNELPLTATQQAEAISYAKKLGVPAEAITVSENMNTSYKMLFGQERLYIGIDVLPAVGEGFSANSRIGMKGALAHEIVGHRAAEIAGKTQANLYLEEAQASIRAARFAPELSSTERFTLIRDGLDRLHGQGLRINDVRNQLWINMQ